MAFVPSVDNSNPVASSAWDGAAAIRRLLKAGGAQRAASAATVVRGPFASVDEIPDEAPLSGSDGLQLLAPHHDYLGGKTVLSRAGVIAAMAAMKGARAEPQVSDDLKRAGIAHLMSHAAVLDLPMAEEEEMRALAATWHLPYKQPVCTRLAPAPVQLRGAADPYGEPTEAFVPRFEGAIMGPWQVLTTAGDAYDVAGEVQGTFTERAIRELADTVIDPDKNWLVGTVQHSSFSPFSFDPGGAVGYIRGLKAARRDEDGVPALLSKMEWTAHGQQLIQTGAFTHLSVEFVQSVQTNKLEVLGFGLVYRPADRDNDLARLAQAGGPGPGGTAHPESAPEEESMARVHDPLPPVPVTTAGPGVGPEVITLPALVPAVGSPSEAGTGASAEVLAAQAEATALRTRLDTLEAERRHEQHERLVDDLVLNQAGESRLDPKFRTRAVTLLDALAVKPAAITTQAAGDPADTYLAFKVFLSALPARSLKASGQSVPGGDVATLIQQGNDLAEARAGAEKMGRTGEAANAFIQTHLQRKGYSAQAAEGLAKGVN